MSFNFNLGIGMANPGARLEVNDTFAVDIVSCLYNGTNYYCTDSEDFK